MAEITSVVDKVANINYEAKEKCWYDECNCDDIPIGECEPLFRENDKGVGRFACLMQDQHCYNPKFFTSFMKKLACQLTHIIQNICALWDIVQCIIEYLKKLGDMGTVHSTYTRNSAVSSADFYHDFNDEYDVSLYMDSTTGVVDGESDDGRRQMTDRRYRAFIRWCADGTGMDPSQDNTTTFTVYHSGENYTEDMNQKRSVHWQIMGASEKAMEMSDTIIMPAGTYVKVRVKPVRGTGTFRVHQFRVEYTPIIDPVELPPCLK